MTRRKPAPYRAPIAIASPVAAIVLPLLLAGCMDQPRTPQAPVVVPQSTPTAPLALSDSWKDMPVAAGSWVYLVDARGSQAMFGRPGAEADVVLRCEPSRRQVMVSMPGGGASSLTVQTSSGAARVAAAAMPGALPGGPPHQGAVFAAADPLLDRIAFSRGRFALTLSGVQPLILPAWAEPARVIEDCRR